MSRAMEVQTRSRSTVSRGEARTSKPTMWVQAKLTMNQPGDPYEREADRVADQVMQMPSYTSLKSDKLASQILRKPAGDAMSNLSVPTDFDQVIAGLRTEGAPLQSNSRKFFETRFGTGFDNVRIHAGGRAAGAAALIGARAFTFGTDIVFGNGEYAPQTTDGQRLLAHELTHVLQQGKSTWLTQTTDGMLQRDSLPEDSTRLPADPDAFHGISLYFTQNNLPFNVMVPNNSNIRMGNYILAPNVRNPVEGTPRVMYYIAYRTDARRNEYVVGPDSLDLFLKHHSAYQFTGNLSYSRGEPRPYEVEYARFIDAMFRGDVSGAKESWILSWEAAMQDSAWWEQAIMSTAGGLVASESSVVTRPPTPPPTLRLILGGGRAAVPLAEPPLATGFGTQGGAALQASPVALAQPVAPPLRLVPPLPAQTPPVPIGPSAQAVAAAFGTATLSVTNTSTQAFPVDQKVRRCQERYPGAIPIHWPMPLWHFEKGINDPGSRPESSRFDLPDQPLLVKIGSSLYNPSRPEIGRYRTRIEGPPFNLTVPLGWPIHHKWPLFLGGPGDTELAEGEYDANGNILAPPNLVVISPQAHEAWHKFLSLQPLGPYPGMGPSNSTPDGTLFCVIELM
ncbi:DUF4157 domain-containing protein [Paenibacillus contaminans]|uniref:eCIS core domain-containing protein n=1 Tax=Paenibacillus contaminans TaxID=450362 RepID=A0A329LU11_9BACL|nr:DUF4157 domain-containing protein [Paenibacillus contaminans]RAV11475.1 hypothetical protein DQG23_36120 [Paenibacillus contaminans]